MRVKLTQDIIEPNGIKVAVHRGRLPIFFEKDAVIEMSEATGQKYIDTGRGVKVMDNVAASK